MEEKDIGKTEAYAEAVPENAGSGETSCGGQAKKWLKTIAAVLACLMLLLGESLMRYANGETEVVRELPTVQESAAV